MAKPEKIVPEQVIDFKIKDEETTLTSKDAVIYALGIGYSQDHLDESDLMFTYELDQDFRVFPTIGATFLEIEKVFGPLANCPGIPKFNPMMILHGEHKIEVFKPVSPNTKIFTTGRISDIADKGKGAFVTFELTSFELSDDGKKIPLLKNTLGLFMRGMGGFGFKGRTSSTLPKIPERCPDKIIEEKTTPNQAVFYRLTGDSNPLHVDPNMASIGGFNKPILHGLCTYGICTKLATKAFCDGDVNKIKSCQARFTSHVFPGETLEFSAWKEGNQIIFSAKTTERGKQVIQGVVEIENTPLPKL